MQDVNDKQQVMTVKDWLITMILLGIPVVGFILTIVWAFGAQTTGKGISRANFCKAYMIVLAIGVVLSIVLWGTIMGALVGLAV